MKTPHKHFDLPSQHLTGDKHYIPPKARKPDEIDWRRSLPRGSVLAEHEYRGLLVLSETIEVVQDESDIAYITGLAAPSAMNSAWYRYARSSDVMRRRIMLPKVGRGQEGSLLDEFNMLDNAKLELSDAVMMARGLMHVIERGLPGRIGKAMILGRALGEASLAFACVPAGDRMRNMTPFIAQAWAREQGLMTLNQARSMESDLGTAPSVAQFSDPNSDIAVEIRRHAPVAVEEAFEQALVVHAMPR